MRFLSIVTLPSSTETEARLYDVSRVRAKMRRLLANGWIVTMDDAGTEHESGWVLVDESVVSAVGRGAPPEADEVVDLAGAVVTPGLVNTHHHLFQTLTRARAQEADLFTWLRELYPVWARLDDEAEYAAARTGLAELALSGCTTVFDHHYVFPRGTSGLVEAEVRAARRARRAHRRLARVDGSRRVGGRATAGLGGGGRGRGAGGDGGAGRPAARARGGRDGADRRRAVLAVLGDEAADGRLGGRWRGGSACSSTRISRRPSRRTRTAGSCTAARRSSTSPELGWTASDVWCAHCVHLSPADVQTFAGAGVGVAHCPTSNLRLGAGVAPVRELVDAGVRVGLGVDGSASNERSDLFFDVKQALLVARGRGGPAAMTCREALRLGTRGGAAVLARDDIGSIEAGKCADLAVWRTDGLELGGAEDPVAGLVLSAPHRVDRLLVGGEDVVRDGQLVRAEEDEIAREHRAQASRFAP